MSQEEIGEEYKKLNDNEKVIFSMGRESVLNDFDVICLADAFISLTDEEFKAVKKFFYINSLLRKEHGN